jgi:hypothetical protein
MKHECNSICERARLYLLYIPLGNDTELAACLGVRAMVFLTTAIMGATVLAGKRGDCSKREPARTYPIRAV